VTNAEKNVRDWLRSLRHQDAVLASEQDYRDRHRGCLNTGGRNGIARRVDIDDRIEIGSGKTDLDGRPIVEEQEPSQE
jgi:hypothetical protein